MFYPLLNLVAYIVMIVVNTLAIIIPLGGMTTGELSDKYDSLFTPIAFTFSIWSIIYTLLLIFVIVGIINLIRGKNKKNTLTNQRINWLFGLTCLFNGGWMLAWQYQYVGLSVIIMLGFLVTLIRLYTEIRKNTNHLNAADTYITLPTFSIYLGWISVATIANISAWLISVQWGAWGISPVTWTIIMIIIATLLGLIMLAKNRDVFFTLVILWALYGIMSKRISVDPVVFASIITTTQVCMAFLVGAMTGKFFIRK
ncbi:MAG: hypothetical protein WC753_04060 [Candidatus Gracilibacteria bacterium]